MAPNLAKSTPEFIHDMISNGELTNNPDGLSCWLQQARNHQDPNTSQGVE